MRRYRLSLPATLTIGAAILLGAAGTGWADPAVAVLGVEPVDVPEPLTQALTDALRQRASATAGIRMVPGKDLVEMKMIFGCDGEQAICMAQAGRSLGADKLLYGTLKKQSKTSNNVVVALKLLDVTTGTIERFVNETVNKKELAGGNVNAAAARWFGALVEVEAKPTLTLTTDPPGATLTIDGQPGGRTPLTLRDLAPGSHTIVLTAPGRQTVTKTVELRAGATHEMSLQLEAEAATPQTPPPPSTAPEPVITQPPPPKPEEQPAGHPGRAARGLAIGAFGAAVISGAVAIYTWRTYRNLEDTAHGDLQNLTPMANAGNKSFFDNPNCSPPTSLSGPSVQTYKNHCSSGQTYANATTALWVTAGVLAAAGVVGVVVGDRQAAHAREKKPTAARLMQQSLRIAPVFSTQAGGVSASFEF
jgi:PEGA domain